MFDGNSNAEQDSIRSDTLKRSHLHWAVLAISASFAAGCSGTSEEEAVVQAVREKVAYGLIDPSSAQFRDINYSDGFVCGQVNGKNRLGGYVGYKPFFGTKSGDIVIGQVYDPDDDTSRALYEGMYNANCDENGVPRPFEERLKRSGNLIPS